jgi:cytochrome c oxidase subunit 1
LAADEVLVTRVVDAEPDHVLHAPLPTIMPLVTALATAGLIIACLFTPWGLPAGVALVSVSLFVWFWPTDRDPAFDTHARARTEADKEMPR